MTSSADAVAKSASGPARWRLVGEADSAAFEKARTETLNLVQWLARVANSYVAARAPEDRIVLTFRAADATFVTKVFDDKLMLELRLPTLEMQFLENGERMPHILDPEERSPAEVEAWLLVELLHRRVDRDKFSKKLPYTIPGLMSGDAAEHSPQACKQGLMQLMTWFQNAAPILEAAAGSSGKIGIACWPQTLELFSVAETRSKAAKFGFSPGDRQNAEPYFFKSKPESNGSAGNIKHSILTASKLLASKNPAAAAFAFLKSGG